LRRAGITDVLIVSGTGHAGHFLELLGSGASIGMNISYEVQEEPGGIAQALGLAEDYLDGEKAIVILGDNVFEEDVVDHVREFVLSDEGAMIILTETERASSYGVAEIIDDKIVGIEEKPENPKSNLAVTGLYMYDSHVFDVIKKLKPSGRGELEITDVNNDYIDRGKMDYKVTNGFWGDCGENFDSLMEASTLVQQSALSRIHLGLSANKDTKKSKISADA